MTQEPVSERSIAASVSGTSALPVGRPLARHLTALCLSIVLPVFAIAAALAWSYVHSERSRLSQAALEVAAGASLALDRDLSGLIGATEVLGLSLSLQSDDLEYFDGLARRVRDLLGVNIVMRDRMSRQVVNTRLPRGAPLPQNPDFASDRRVLETGRPDISDLLQGAVTRAPLFIANIPVRRDAEVAYFLNLSLPTERVRDILLERSPPPGWAVTVVDRRGVVVADTLRHAALVGTHLPERFWQGAASDTRRLARPDSEGGPVLAAHLRSPLSGWTTVVTVPSRQAEAPLRRSVAISAAVAVGLLALAAVLASRFARRIAQPVSALAAQARRLGERGEVDAIATPVSEVNAVGGALVAAAANLREHATALRESDIRLRLAMEAARLGSWEIDLRNGMMLRTGKVIPARSGLPLTGYSLEEFFGRVVHPEDMPRVRETFTRVAEGRAAAYRVDYRVRTPDDAGWIWMESHGGVVEHDPASGLPLRIAGVSQDVSERKAAEAARAEGEARLRAVLEQMPVGIAVAEAPSGRLLYHNRRGVEILGHPMLQTGDIANYSRYGALHPDGRSYAPEEYPIARAVSAGARVEAEEMTYRRGDGTLTCLEVSAAPVYGHEGTITLAVSTFTDISARKQAEQTQVLLAREVNHRAKNALAVVQSVVALTKAEDTASYAAAIKGRIGALARAHTRLAQSGWVGADLRALLEEELCAFAASGGDTEEPHGPARLTLSGPPIALPVDAAAPLAMAVHELATNAVKYGALSVTDGWVQVGWDVHAEAHLRLAWAEHGGPCLDGPPEQRGFGSRMLNATIRNQLGGSLLLDWPSEGLRCEIEFPLKRAGWGRTATDALSHNPPS